MNYSISGEADDRTRGLKIFDFGGRIGRIIGFLTQALGSKSRVQSPTFGASERFVVSPGHEEEGICHLPGGQSGNPLSLFYRAGHEAWARGEFTPFLPGPTAHTFRLEP